MKEPKVSNGVTAPFPHASVARISDTYAIDGVSDLDASWEEKLKYSTGFAPKDTSGTKQRI